MNVEIQINNSNSPKARYVTWSPSPCRIRISNPAGMLGVTAQVRLSRTSAATAGDIQFAATAAGPYSNTLSLTLSRLGNSVSFFVRGVFGRPSAADGDVRIVAQAKLNPLLSLVTVGTASLMVRVRKNANALSAAERTRFVNAIAQLNNQGLGRFADFRDMHTAASDPEAHQRPGFLAWHRAYILDLERELQAIDSSVSLPYWNFNQPSPIIFTPDFLGSSNALGNVQFSPTNPLQFWKTDNVVGIVRRPLFNTNQAPAVRSEAGTLGLGNNFAAFRTMEGNPHGSAHVNFGGSISSIPTAARDPLFFLLHCNVDRLWAKWQTQNGRLDPNLPPSFDPNNPGNKAGHNLNDTMWPWNGVTGGGRPPTAPGGTLANSVCVAAPGQQPRVRDVFDYKGSLSLSSHLGFAYDDIP